MANVIFAFPNWCAGTTLATPTIDAFGSWEPVLPASNVLDAMLSSVARSTDSATASTRLRIDLGAVRDVRVVAVPKSNIGTAGRIKVTLYSDSGYSAEVATTGWGDYWQDVYEWGVRPWGTPDLFSNKFSSEEAAGYPAVWYHVFELVHNARYVQVDFDDTGNGDGYVEVSRLVVAPAWQASINPVYGQTSITWEARSRVRRSRTGVRFVDRQRSPRVARCSFDYLPESEGFTYPFEMARRQDLDGEVFFITDPDDTTQALRRAFMATLRVLPSLSYNSYQRFSTAVELEEVL